MATDTMDLHGVPLLTARSPDAATVKRVGSSVRREMRRLGNGSPHGLSGQQLDELQLWFRRIRVQFQALELSLLFEQVLTELGARQEW